MFSRLKAALRRWRINEKYILDLFQSSSSNLPLDLALSEPDELLEAGRNAAWRDHQHELAHDYFVRSLAVARSRSDRAGMARAILAIGTHLVWNCPQTVEDSGITQDDPCDVALRMFRELGDEVGISASLRGLDRYEESLAISRRIGDTPGIVRCLAHIAILARELRPELAAVWAHEGVQLARETGDEELLAHALRSVGMLTQTDDVERCRAWIEAAEIYRTIGYGWEETNTRLHCALLVCDQEPALRDQLLDRAIQISRERRDDYLEKICREHSARFAAERNPPAV